ncbi:MAG: hypothetical protein IJ087_17725, partial [Eggerthellaceae bacterium]|nr:hypothetical protein [Eggerthellaceae bacterium]
TSLRNSLGTYIYFANPITLDHEGKWYDGLNIWAYSDEVVGSDVGKKSAVVPTHFFVSSHYDTLPTACGIATGEGTAGTANVKVKGSVDAKAAYGNACALDAECAKDAAVSWDCEDAALAASTGDTLVHPIAAGTFDLRDFIDFKHSSQTEKVSYVNTSLVRFELAQARSVVVGDGVTFAGPSASGDAAASNDGAGAVTFKVGNAVVARVPASASSFDLAVPSDRAQRADDQRQSDDLVGWSLTEDENATSVDCGTTGTIEPVGGTVYHAVYNTGFTTVPVEFVGMFDQAGSSLPAVSLDARYGQTVGSALEGAGVSLPTPSDYADASSGVQYRFVGWYPYTSTANAALLLNADQVRNLEVSLLVDGVRANGKLALRAAYVAVEPSQHIVSFESEGYTSVCVVDDGARPVYTTANNLNSSYVSPARQTTVAGSNFVFDGWYVDGNGDGDRGDGERLYEGILPAATADAVYAAQWSETPADVTYTFYINFIDSTGQFLNPGNNIVSTTCDVTAQSVADKVSTVGSRVGYGGKVYTLLGWSTRATD